MNISTISCNTLLYQDPIELKNSDVVQSTYFDFEGMDKSVLPSDDFYRYACGKWLETNQIPKGHADWGSFPMLRKKVNDNLGLITTWGAFGAVIAHEIIHSFDNNGRKYDAEGDKSDWWQEQDAKNYEMYVDEIVEQFNNYTIKFDDETSLNVNGKMTLGENIADFGGLNVAFAAMQKTKFSNF